MIQCNADTLILQKQCQIKINKKLIFFKKWFEEEKKNKNFDSALYVTVKYKPGVN